MTDGGHDSLRPGDTCWRVESATAASVIVDAADYFRHARSAMLKARKRIMLIGWDFDARIDLGTSEEARDAPSRVGDFILWLVENNPDLEVFLLRWDLGALKTLFRGSTLFTVLKWMRHPRIHTKLDARHPPAASHHQKIVVIDDCFAFCGGIDMTGDRWDTRAHHDDEPGRRQPNGKPYKPWHDATTALTGPVAAALGDHARMRWERAGGHSLQPVGGVSDCWPEALERHFDAVTVAIARSAPEMPDCAPVIEIERLYLDQIARAERFIYAESQYFASRKIAEAIARRLDEADGPEIVLINPVAAQGWLEPLAMDTARARLYETLHRRDPHHRFRIYHPHTAGGAPIYVHAKIMIVDDRTLRVGSSNMNNRSMRLDTECDVTISTASAGNGDYGPVITGIRDGLIAEHLGLEVAAVTAHLSETGSLIGTIEALRGTGKTLVPYETPDLNEVEAWLADNEVLDSEGPGATLEGIAKGGLFRRLRRHKR
ncbi:phospholipase D-like domain-containing protein [Sphingomonas sp. TREG-RG-20F-R18-01]|uniref:phospholipase D-like domain-containing protein n=1 Tax=Sphingomonas sp. TREG-RG-20F-R18-01 TaxID=2914982 RepID=UPI001F59B397|nr:phospholipase D-like domain-containing protein [Sphingomonas sp. TREG-RG-20F-R18-01]